MDTEAALPPYTWLEFTMSQALQYSLQNRHPNDSLGDSCLTALHNDEALA